MMHRRQRGTRFRPYSTCLGDLMKAKSFSKVPTGAGNDKVETEIINPDILLQERDWLVPGSGSLRYNM